MGRARPRISHVGIHQLGQSQRHLQLHERLLSALDRSHVDRHKRDVVQCIHSVCGIMIIPCSANELSGRTTQVQH